MKTLAIASILTFISSPVFAATSTHDSGMVLAYCFLGMCGLIIFLQMLPIFGMLFGMFKATSKKQSNYHS